MDEIKSLKIKKASKYVNHIFALNPDLLWSLPDGLASFLPYTVSSWYEIQRTRNRIDKEIVIVHSPTSREIKGTDLIIDAVKRIKKRHSNIRFVMVENVPNKKAIEIYKRANIVIDQVLVGWYGGFAVEAMKMGKPVAVFLRDEDLRFVPLPMVKDLKDAIINISPFNIDCVLEEYLNDSRLLIKKSEAALEFVHKWHDPEYVAGITKSYYEA